MVSHNLINISIKSSQSVNRGHFKVTPTSILCQTEVDGHSTQTHRRLNLHF